MTLNKILKNLKFGNAPLYRSYTYCAKILLLARHVYHMYYKKMCCMYPQQVVCNIIITQKMAFNVRPELSQFTKCARLQYIIFA